MRSKRLSRNNARIVRVRGNSMSDRINDGDILLVDTSVNALVHDGVYVIELEGEDHVKLLQRYLYTGGVNFLSCNPDYPAQTLEGESANRLRITGRVVWHGGEL
ncbi:helix-turn-helix transcriptional regulator [Comamonas thiooxydans]|uniref:S24 family peptidase n=1 Tax=Comamonas thiooxydans TaxID=363952 RepID=UPI0022B235CA|nr:S24 family peptidase [Comamonas thiooxydans]